MRRMFIQPGIAYPSEKNKVFCEQFVADTLVATDLEPGYYAVQLISNTGDSIISSLDFFNFSYESTYGSIIGKYFYDNYDNRVMCLVGEFSANSKTITFSLVDAQGNTIQSPRDWHIDIYKL